MRLYEGAKDTLNVQNSQSAVSRMYFLRERSKPPVHINTVIDLGDRSLPAILMEDTQTSKSYDLKCLPKTPAQATVTLPHLEIHGWTVAEGSLESVFNQDKNGTTFDAQKFKMV